ncbi:MAG: TIGR01777 family oxidoreductase [Desulfobacterales bacterium]|nr:TIGR01777 family oxidoreductase [Desulfobacterales bacterium]
MKIFITGGTGFVGTHLSNFLLSRGHEVTAVGIRPSQNRINHENFHYISGDTSKEGRWQEELKNIDAVVNLAGASIFKRWNKSYKQLIYDSRILTTRNLVGSLPKDKKVVLCSTSAVGYYGDRGNDTLTEEEPNGDGFLAQVCADWEKEARRAEEKGIRVATTRFGIVLGKNGGALKKMIAAFRFYLGGPLGNGMQWFPWIHMEDLVSAMLFIMENEKMNGPVNFCSPNPVRNRDLAKTLGHILNRPALMPAPAFIIRLVMGEFGNTILTSQKAVPEKLLKHGFNFQYSGIQAAISDIVKS